MWPPHGAIKSPGRPRERPHFEQFTTGVPLSWDELNGIPRSGVVELSYLCSLDNVKLKLRRRLATGG